MPLKHLQLVSGSLFLQLPELLSEREFTAQTVPYLFRSRSGGCLGMDGEGGRARVCMSCGDYNEVVIALLQGTQLSGDGGVLLP